MIAGLEAPPWVPDLLSNLAPSIALDRNVHASKLTRAAILRRLGEVHTASSLLIQMLNEPSIRAAIDAADDAPIQYHGLIDRHLRDLTERAARASTSPTLTTQAGKAKSGRGRAAAADVLSPQAFCALVIVETWKHFRGDYPAPRNKEAAAAAEAYWRAAGGQRNAWGLEPLNAWRYHFQKASESERAAPIRAKIQHHLLQDSKRWASRSSADLPPGGKELAESSAHLCPERIAQVRLMDPPRATLP